MAGKRAWQPLVQRGVEIGLLLLLLWPIAHFSERYFTTELTQRQQQTLDLYVAHLQGTLGRFEVLPQILGHLPVVRLALLQPEDSRTLSHASQLLEQTRLTTGADVIYLLNEQGVTLAASNWESPVSFIGKDFSFRPYFRQAKAGQLGRFFGLGTTSGKRGYYFASAVASQADGARGVIVVKVDLDGSEPRWGNTPEQLIVSDQHGVVILSSNALWRFQSLGPLSSGDLAEIADERPYPTVTPSRLNLDWTDFTYQQRYLPALNWTVSILTDQHSIDEQVNSVLAIAVVTLLALALLVEVLMQRRRHYLAHIALQEQVTQELEQRVEQRTQDLRQLNDRLKQEVLERQQAQDERLRMQDELVQAGKLSALGTMAATIGHELNQPLAAIRNYADNTLVFLEQQRLPEARRNLQQIATLTARMSGLIAQLRAYPRRERDAAVSVELEHALHEALSLLEVRTHSLSIQVHLELPNEPVWVQAGVARLQQVLLNLLNNALDAIEAYPDSSRQLWIHLQNALEDGVQLCIHDSGSGLNAEALRRAGEPFFTTKRHGRGLGLGLAICQNIVTSLHGSLRLGNHPHGGAQAILELQRAGAPSLASTHQDATGDEV